MTKMRVIAKIGVVSFAEFRRKKAQTENSAAPSTNTDNEIEDAFTPEQITTLYNPSSLQDLKSVIDQFPSIMEKAVSQVDRLPAEKKEEGQAYLQNLQEYFDQMELFYSTLLESSEQQSESVEQPEINKTALPEFSQLVGNLESRLSEIQSFVDSSTTDYLVYSPNIFKQNMLQHMENLVTDLNNLYSYANSAYQTSTE